MASSDRIEVSPTLSSAAIWSGYAGVLPFVVGLLGVLLAPAADWRLQAQQAAVDYGAVILSFVGALHWGLALALLVVGFGLFWLYEHQQLRDRLPADYLGMRRNLTLAVCGTLALTMFASESVGLR